MFYLSLARELGMTKQMLLKNLDSREITEWIAYFKIIDEDQNKKDNNTSVIEAGIKMGIEDLSRKAKNRKGSDG